MLRLHEHLCFLRAYSDNALVLARIVRMVKYFIARPDWRRLQSALVDAGIAATIIRHRFFWPTARWQAARSPAQSEIDWQRGEEPDRFFAALPL